MRIEIIISPNENLKETGFGSMIAYQDIMASIQRLGHSVLLTMCKSLSDLQDVAQRNPHIVILTAKYISIKNGDNIWFSEYFSLKKITFSGSNRETLKYDSDKALAKTHLATLGIKTAKYFLAIPYQYKFEEELPLPFPFFLKPTDAANGNGVDDQSFVENFSEFENKVMSLYDAYRQPVLVEEYLDGKEFTAAIIENRYGEVDASAIEIIPPLSSGKLRILGATVKTLNTESLNKIEINDLNAVKKIAIASFKGLGARGFGRIDIKMDSHGICYFMEANLVPGMNRHTSYFPRACKIANMILYDEVIHLILDECVNRATSNVNLINIDKMIPTFSTNTS